MDCLTIDVEDWFHILDCDAVPSLKEWPDLPARVQPNMEKVLDLAEAAGVKATFFWLGWVAERNPALVRRCVEAGHEIASHGYAHVLPGRTGPRQFRADIARAKAILEDISGTPVRGFRTAGFGVLRTTPWALDIIRETNHLYDASIFPTHHGHGGMVGTPLAPYLIHTPSGSLWEIPPSVVEVLGRRVSLFGGGYLRLAHLEMIKWGVARLHAKGRPLVVYFHPRDIDPDQPRLPLPLIRRFKCYVRLHTTFDKVKWLCANCRFGTMADLLYIHRTPQPTESPAALRSPPVAVERSA